MDYFKLVGFVLVVLAFGAIFTMGTPTANVIGGSVDKKSIDPAAVTNLVDCAEVYGPACGGYCMFSSTTDGTTPSGSESSAPYRGTETSYPVGGSETSRPAAGSQSSGAASGSSSSTSVSGSETSGAYGGSTTTYLIGQCKPAPSGGCSCQP